jgi:hypothetical protein
MNEARKKALTKGVFLPTLDCGESLVESVEMEKQN